MGMLGNRYQVDCTVACMGCGATGDLMQIAHRNGGDQIVGYIFECPSCFPMHGYVGFNSIDEKDDVMSRKSTNGWLT